MKWLFIPLMTACFFVVQNVSAYGQSDYYGEHLCGYPGFSCISVKRGDTWRKLFPNRRDREVVKRLNRTNMRLSYRSWIVVPTNLKNAEHLDMSPFPNNIKAMGQKLIVVNLGLLAFAAYNQDGSLIHWGPVSGGRNWCNDIGKPCKTATGNFKVIQKKGPECESSKFPIESMGGAPMPYCMHYFRGFALHGSRELPGYHASHGCIRLFLEDAKWLNKKFTDVGTRIIVMPSKAMNEE